MAYRNTYYDRVTSLETKKRTFESRYASLIIPNLKTGS